MANKKKNSNYVTDKTSEKKAALAKKKRAKETRETVKNILVIAGVIIVALALIFAVLYFCGVFDAEPTEHISITLDGYDTTLHAELYGNDAPETVKHILSLVNGGYFTAKSVNAYKDGNLYLGNETSESESGIKGEFAKNSVNNTVPFEVGTLVMARGEGYDSGYGRFFIVTEETDVASLQGNYAAFGKITGGYDVIKDIIAKLTPNADGSIYFGEQVKILSISTHGSH